jgi:hypothetical protein
MIGVIPTGAGALVGLKDLSPKDVNAQRSSGAEGAGAPSDFPRDVVSVESDLSGHRGGALSVRSSLDLAIAAGRQSLSILGEISDLAARAADPNAPAEARAVQDQALRGLLSRLGETIDQAIAGGARALSGEPVGLGGEDRIEGLDLRPGGRGATVSLGAGSVLSEADAQSTAVAARESFSRVSAGLARLQEAAAGFDVHAEALAALDKGLAASVQSNLDQDGARLLALQVRQALAGSDQSIANAGAGILSHFRI